MAGLSEALTKKYGPLPVWAWAVIGAGIAFYVLHKTSSAASTATAPVGAPNMVDTGAATGGGGGGGIGGSAGGSTGGTGTTGSGGAVGGSSGGYDPNALYNVNLGGALLSWTGKQLSDFLNFNGSGAPPPGWKIGTANGNNISFVTVPNWTPLPPQAPTTNPGTGGTSGPTPIPPPKWNTETPLVIPGKNVPPIYNPSLVPASAGRA